jgi:regulator of cell morphogenesis and NO signaling
MTETRLTLGELVARRASNARVLDQMGLDYCCHGDESLDHACAHAGIDPDAVIAALADAEPAGDDHECGGMSPEELIAHLLDTHHAYLHEALPELERLAGKVRQVHGPRHPELEHVHTLVSEIAADLEPHMLKEEQVLFPSILRLTSGPAEFPFGSIRNPIAMMSIEHDRVGQLLADLRAATNEYSVPADGCASYRSLYERLAELEHDTHVHVFEENHLLFPRVLARQAEQS